MKTVLVTGGAGYVGSHCCKAFAKAGWQVVSFDNLSRGWRDAVKWGPLIEGDICDAAALASALGRYRPDLVAHFAAYAYVAESIERPDIYYRNNSFGSLTLLEEMHKAEVRKLIFSSTCATYGIPSRSPIDESHRQSPINPYGWSKFIIERMLEDYGAAYGFNSVALRYFNAAGCDPEGEIGERHEPEPHLIPLAIAAALDEKRVLTVNGADFQTRDGSAVRDYVHVADLARAHVLAGEFLVRQGGVHVFNLGTGIGTTVFEIAEAVGRACGRELALRVGPRRPGDPPILVASAEKARRELGWSATDSTIDFIVETAMAWQKATVR
jgi:UDP-arabinose 4-epimerase